MILLKLMGIFLAYIGGASFITEILKRAKCKEYTAGKVIDIVEKVKEKKRETKVFLYPVFEYIVNGNTYTEQFDVGSGRKNFKYSVGDEVEIHYVPNEPQKYYVKGNVDGFIGYTILLGIGLVLLFV